MATLRVYKYFEVELDGHKHSGGSRSSPIEITVDQCVEHQFSLAATTTKTIWTGTSDELSSFDFLWIESSAEIRVELTVDSGNEVGDELWGLVIPAEKPFDLMADDALAAYTANFATATADVIDRLRIRNAGSSAANVRVWMAKD